MWHANSKIKAQRLILSLSENKVTDLEISGVSGGSNVWKQQIWCKLFVWHFCLKWKQDLYSPENSIGQSR